MCGDDYYINMMAMERWQRWMILLVVVEGVVTQYSINNIIVGASPASRLQYTCGMLLVC